MEFINWDTVRSHRVSHSEVEVVVRQERQELARCEQLYRGVAPALTVARRVVILADDGLAADSTMCVAVEALRQQRPLEIIVAIPVAAPEAREALAEIADRVVCAITAEPFGGVGLWYDDFSATGDDEVRSLLRLATNERSQMLQVAR